MKRILVPTLFALTFSVMFSSTSFGEWTKVSESVNGDTFYVDFERIRKHDGYVFWWDLSDLLKPNKWGSLSGKTYQQGDCKLFRYKILSTSFHKGPMGTGDNNGGSNKPGEWSYPPPNSSYETILKSVCSR